MCDRPLVATKYMDTYTLRWLGLLDEVTALCTSFGWGDFITRRNPTCQELTLEFLSSIKANFSAFNEPTIRCLHFRLMGQDYLLNAETFGSLLGLPSGGARWIGAHFSTAQAWLEFTGRTEYNPSQSKSTHLRSHSLRYIHRFMAHSFFGRAESTGVVSKAELYFLWAMVHQE